jgi:ABC-type Fe3+/spermidine/putrescine transport system ATPase subunit
MIAATGAPAPTVGRELSGPSVRAHGVTVSYGDTRALRAVDLVVEPGQTMAVLGPSGSGKTTLLYAMAGFLGLDAGTIELAGRLVSSPGMTVPPERRPVAMVFQHYGLWPHLDARDTVAYPLRRAGTSATLARSQADDLLEQMRVGHLAARRPAELSGGEQQRVGLARALARRPAVYLLDEPTAHLDAALTAELQSELSVRLHADGAAAILATHDVDEALAVADRVALLRDGRIVQVGSPVDVYERPVDEWAAGLTGPASFVSGALRAHGVDLGIIDVDRGGAPSRDGAGTDGGTARYLVRPDWVRLGGPSPAIVRGVAFRGTHTDYRLDADIGEVLLRDPGPPRLAPGERTTYRVLRAWRLPTT